MSLDNHTLLLSLVIVSLAIALSLAIVTSPSERNGLKKWSAAMALEGLAWLLISGRGVLPDSISIIAANIIIAAAQALKLAALYEYRAQPCPPWQCLLPVAGMAILLTSISYDNVAARFASVSLVLSLQMLLIVVALFSDQGSKNGRAWRLLFWATVAVIPLLLLRAVYALSAPATFALPNNTVTPNPLQMTLFVFIIALGIMGSLGFILMIKERVDREMRLLATTDPLTGVLNRRAFMQRADQEWSLAQRNQLPLALLMVDVDHFKAVNDRHGHSAGDLALVQVAHTLVSRLRKQDSVCRYGGEEFCILLPCTDSKGALALAEIIRTAIGNTPLAVADANITLTVSIGVASIHFLHPSCEEDVTALFELADNALYQAKNLGRNCVVMEICELDPGGLIKPIQTSG